MTDNSVLTIRQAGYLADLIKGVEQGKKLRYYAIGTDDADHPLVLVMRAFTREGGGFWAHDADIRESYIWCSGIVERWFSVRELMTAMQNAIDGDIGMDQPMAMIDEQT